MNSNLNYIYLAFEKQAARSPTKIAIIDNGKSFTFKELNESANRLARYFKSQNIKKGKGIALYLDRSFKSIVSILAAWKNECFYIPINIDLPQLYVNNIISDATPKVILLEKTATFLNEHKCLIIDIDQAVAESMRFSSNNIKLSPSIPDIETFRIPGYFDLIVPLISIPGILFNPLHSRLCKSCIIK